jgi:hypothetical protein
MIGADSAFLRTDEDDITSQTDLIGGASLKLGPTDSIIDCRQRYEAKPSNKNVASFGSFGRTLIQDGNTIEHGGKPLEL